MTYNRYPPALLHRDHHCHQYTHATYWAIATMTSTGYGDIAAHNELEMLYASFVMIFAQLLFGFVLGNITSTLVGAARLMRSEFTRQRQNRKMGTDVSAVPQCY